MKDPYQLLGVAKSASQDEIKKAYRKLAKDLHPDLHPGNKKKADQFAEVSAAYDFLSDAEKRARYDRGEIDASGAEVRPRGGYYWSQADQGGGRKYQRGFKVDDMFSAEDIFSDLFGRGGRAGAGPGGRSRGADVTYALSVSFRDAARGARKTVRLATGKTLEINIPAGTAEGQRLRLKGQGEPGLGGGPAGDAYVEIHVEPDPAFTRKDQDIHSEAKVPLQTAVLGGSITVDTIHGPVSVKVPKHSSSGTTLRLKGKGVEAGGKQGDHFVKLLIALPDAKDQALMRALEGWAAQTAQAKEDK
jgi:DnaJ-class molecular chaperone